MKYSLLEVVDFIVEQVLLLGISSQYLTNFLNCNLNPSVHYFWGSKSKFMISFWTYSPLDPFQLVSMLLKLWCTSGDIGTFTGEACALHLIRSCNWACSWWKTTEYHLVDMVKATQQFDLVNLAHCWMCWVHQIFLVCSFLVCEEIMTEIWVIFSHVIQFFDCSEEIVKCISRKQIMSPFSGIPFPLYETRWPVFPPWL